MPNAHEFAIPLVQQSFIELGVTLTAAVTVALGALYYFRHVRQERPPVGTFNGRDIGILLGLIIALPFLYAVMPGWLLTCFLALTFAASLSIGYRPVLGAGPVWCGLGALIGANIWESHTMLGTVVGWQVWWAELDILVVLGAIAVANLYVQGGMRLQHVAWFGLALAVYDILSSLVINVTAKLVEEFIGAPLDPTFGMRFNVNNYGIGIGDLLFYALFVVASYKAYGKAAARIALGVTILFGAAAPSLVPLAVKLIDFRNDVLIPSQIFFAPAAFLCYLWLKHRYGRERTMAEYRASTGGAASPAVVAQPDQAPEPASVGAGVTGTPSGTLDPADRDLTTRPA
jgi:hypothetical protein